MIIYSFKKKKYNALSCSLLGFVDALVLERTDACPCICVRICVCVRARVPVRGCACTCVYKFSVPSQSFAATLGLNKRLTAPLLWK